MRGRRTAQKILRDKIRTPVRSSTASAVVGSWRLEENQDGDLVATHVVTGFSKIIAVAPLLSELEE